MECFVKDFGSYKLHLIKTNKFKTITTRVSFRSPIVKEKITMRNILADMLCQATNNYPNKRALTIKAQDLYAADIQTNNSRLGNYTVMDIYLSVLNDKYTEKGNFNDALDFLMELIFNPLVEDNKFNKERLDIVKSSCRDSLNSLKEDSGRYSLIKMFEEFDDNSPISYRMMGYIDDLAKINESNLYQYYKNMINKDLIDIYVCGDIDFKYLEDKFKNDFNVSTYKKVKMDYVIEPKKARNRIIKKEKINNSQSKLSIGCIMNDLTSYERNYPVTLFNIILGGGVDSKLFNEVREKNSLCYTINSVPNKLDNMIIIRAGIDKDNFDKTITLIEKCLNDMKKGIFSDSDINKAKEYYGTAIDDIYESQPHIIENFFLMDTIGTDDIEVKRDKMNKVNKEDIISVAKKVKLDTIFLLEGDINEEN